MADARTNPLLLMIQCSALSPQPQSTALMDSNHYCAVSLRTLGAAESFAVKTAPTGAGLLLPPPRPLLQEPVCPSSAVQTSPTGVGSGTDAMRVAQLCGSGLDRERPAKPRYQDVQSPMADARPDPLAMARPISPPDQCSIVDGLYPFGSARPAANSTSTRPRIASAPCGKPMRSL